jgi:hypothetical protein
MNNVYTNILMCGADGVRPAKDGWRADNVSDGKKLSPMAL